MRTKKKILTRAVAIKTVKEFVKVCGDHNLSFDKVILFGSTARNKAHQWSDIDVAFASKSFKHDPFQDRHILNRLVLKDKKFLDLQFHPFPTKYFNEGDPFIDEIKRTGIEIKM
ncbi:MAG: nucleotidyltransferase domain-containing protein [Chitinophagales bacterium]|nr:nucleotidyltransferase domain-containing protein [Chitinophagales bacterium]